MARHYLIPRKLAKAFPSLRKVLWQIESWGIRCFFSILRHLSVERAIHIASRISGFIGPYTAKARIVKNNLTLALPDKTPTEIDQLARGVFHQLGVALAELIHVPTLWQQHQQRFTFVVDDEHALHKQRPKIFVSGHIGAWQLGGFIARQYSIPLSIVYAPETNPYLEPVFLKIRNALCPMISRDGAVRALMRELSAGRSIGLTYDTRLDSGKPIPLFGIDALTNTTPARLALRNNCDLLPVHVQRLPHTRYRIHIGRPIQPANPLASPQEQIDTMSCQLNQQLEAWIRATPDQWMCLKRRWPKNTSPQQMTNKKL